MSEHATPRGATLITPRHFHDRQLAERYLAEQLSAQEQAELEEYYSDHPQALQDLQAVAAIKIGLAALRASGELAQLTANPRRQQRLALAAALLVAVVGAGPWWRAQVQPDSPPTSAMPVLSDRAGVSLPIVSTHDVQRMRSDVDVIISKPTTAGAVELRLRDQFDPPPARYRLELHALLADGTRRPLATVGELMLDESGWLIVYVDPARLELGSYELRLFEDGAAAQAPAMNDFLLDVVAAAPAAAALIR